tara:strand:+ start:20464 stop:21162 length:699 start_codon:yes stop_codon:yes gene_type:complete
MRLVITIISIFFILNLNCQQGMQTLGGNAQVALTDFANMRKSSPAPLNIQGSQYFNREFKDTKLEYFGRIIDNSGYMRYNAFRDEIEMADSPYQNESDLILIMSKDVIPTIGGERFEYLPHRLNNSNTKIGYLINKYIGSNYILYEKRSKKFMEAKIARTSLENSFPPRYVDDSEIYLSISGNTPFMIKNSKKSILNIFNNSTELRRFIKDEKIRFNDTESIIKVIKFIETN